jgi:putative hemolysin
VASGPWDVLHLLGGESKPLLAEIGRLREVTFRRVGEGTGKDRDLDRFDLAYEHVVLWNRDLREIGGAYRLAATDRLPRRNGLPDLYTGTLFDFTPAFFREVGPALELGRSFVRPEFQRQAAPLALLWRGIGALVSASPRNACLVGAASISARYTEETRRLVVASLRANWSRPELSGLLLPGNPPEDGPDRLAAVLPRTVEGLEERVRRLEPGGAGLPVLLRHYLRLGAAFLSANVDPDFSGAWDVLLLVDLRRSPRVALRRHLGPEGAARFLGWHGVENQSIVPPVS